jgi:beta-glucosidase
MSFLYGAATAAYQIEGAWDEDGKGPSIWDAFVRVPGAIESGDTGDDACDHYHRWRDDVGLMAELGLTAYRFSVSWARVLPDGFGRVNERGLAFYDELVDALCDAGIRPFVTLYHWDLPQALQERGGWDGAGVDDAFAHYAALLGDRLGDRVCDWITLNEPEVAAFAGHFSGVHAPGLRDFALALRAADAMLRAHGKAIEALPADASVGIALNLSPTPAASAVGQAAGARPQDRAAEGGPGGDEGAARLADGYLNRWFLDAVCGRGYPEDMLEWYGDAAPPQLPVLPPLDFLGVNYYYRRVVRSAPPPLGWQQVTPAGAEVSEMGWEVHPAGLREILVRVAHDYAPGAIYVTENGIALPRGLDDDRRVAYLESHLAAVAAARAAGVPVEGFFVWTLLDNFEWAYGRSKRFGLVEVDYATQRRTIRRSGRWYADVIRATAGHAAVT